jgi:hypothetical protein
VYRKQYNPAELITLSKIFAASPWKIIYFIVQTFSLNVPWSQLSYNTIADVVALNVENK